MNIKIESAPSLANAENFAFLLKECFEVTASGENEKSSLAMLLAQHSEHFDTFIGGSHIALHESGKEARLLLITFEAQKLSQPNKPKAK